MGFDLARSKSSRKMAERERGGEEAKKKKDESLSDAAAIDVARRWWCARQSAWLGRCARRKLR